MRKRRAPELVTIAFLFVCLQSYAQEVEDKSDNHSVERFWSWGMSGGFGYFNFRNSLYADKEPDPPENLGEDWARKLTGTWTGPRSVM